MRVMGDYPPACSLRPSVWASRCRGIICQNRGPFNDRSVQSSPRSRTAADRARTASTWFEFDTRRPANIETMAFLGRTGPRSNPISPNPLGRLNRLPIGRARVDGPPGLRRPEPIMVIRDVPRLSFEVLDSIRQPTIRTRTRPLFWFLKLCGRRDRSVASSAHRLHRVVPFSRSLVGHL